MRGSVTRYYSRVSWGTIYCLGVVLVTCPETDQRHEDQRMELLSPIARAYIFRNKNGQFLSGNTNQPPRITFYQNSFFTLNTFFIAIIVKISNSRSFCTITCLCFDNIQSQTEFELLTFSTQ